MEQVKIMIQIPVELLERFSKDLGWPIAKVKKALGDLSLSGIPSSMVEQGFSRLSVVVARRKELEQRDQNRKDREARQAEIDRASAAKKQSRREARERLLAERVAMLRERQEKAAAKAREADVRREARELAQRMRQFMPPGEG